MIEINKTICRLSRSIIVKQVNMTMNSQPLVFAHAHAVALLPHINGAAKLQADPDKEPEEGTDIIPESDREIENLPPTQPDVYPLERENPELDKEQDNQPVETS